MENSILKKIMLVEDEKDIQTVAKFALEKIGHFEVHYCSSGKEALSEFPKYEPQIVLLDMMMPEMDGMMTLAELKKLPHFKNCLVIFMTAKVQPSEVEEYKSKGAVDVIPKPFNPKDLPTQLNTIWEKHQGVSHD